MTSILVKALERIKTLSENNFNDGSVKMPRINSTAKEALSLYSQSKEGEGKQAGVTLDQTLGKAILQLLIDNRCEPNSGCSYGFTHDDLVRVSGVLAGSILTYKDSITIQSGERGEVERLNQIIELKERERREWADMCIKKQETIEILENTLAVIQKHRKEPF